MSVLGFRWLLRPLLLLEKSVRELDLQHPHNISDKYRIQELNQFSSSFNGLLKRLKIALAELQREIEDHKDSKARLAWSETLYRSVVEDSPGLLCSFLPNGELTFANKSYAEYYETTPEKLVGLSFLKLLHEDDRESVLHEIHRLDKNNPSSSVTQRIYLPSGEVRHQRWVNRALFATDGEIIGYQAFGEDIQKEFQIQQMQSAIYRISQAANRAPTSNELYRSIHEIVQSILHARNFYIALFDEERDLLIPAYYIDEMDAPPSPDPDASRDGPSYYVLKHSESLCCTPAQFRALNPGLDPNKIEGTPPKIWLGVPLMLEGKSMGVLAVQHYHDEKAFGSYEREFLEMIAPTVAATIARQKTEEELHNYAQSNALLFKASQAISKALDLETLYLNLYKIIREVMDCDIFMISDYDASFQKITCAYLMQSGQRQDVSEFPPLPINPAGEGTQSKAIITRKSTLISDYLAQVKTSRTTYYIDADGKLHDPDKKEPAEEPITRSAIIVPVFFGSDVTGVIQVLSFRQAAYTEEDMRIVEALGSQTAIASNNAHLYQQTQHELTLRREAEQELHTLNLQLEERVQKRTIELHERISTVEKLNTGMSNILHDLNIANRRAESNARELSEANAELEAFSYSVSHDLRAPLRHIESFTQLLHQRLDQRLEEDEERYFENIFIATKKMRNLISDLLSLSRASRVDFNLKQLDFEEIIESVRAELFDEVVGRQIKWILAPLPPVQADPGLIRIVWTNLIGNAVKYTRLCETATIEIGIIPTEQTNISDAQQVFFVRDNGVGFDNAYSDKLFGVFQRLHQSEEFEGNGIGLATVRRIIARHGGSVWAESELNHGATFFFSLPIHLKLEKKEDTTQHGE